MKKVIASAVVAMSTATATPAFAKDVTVEIINLTNGFHFTPLLIAVHDKDTHLFQAGVAASANLQAMAEGGDISGLVSDVEAAGGQVADNPAGGLLGPGESASATLDVKKPKPGKARLSVVAMLLPTNDGFAGLDAVTIPKKKGTYRFELNGYDAGTENNDEVINGGGAPGAPGIPAAPGGDGGINGSGIDSPDSNTFVHIHRGTIGDMDPVGGMSDLDSRIHRWLNPVAVAVVTVH
jgi:hypothetical protein